MLNAFYEYPVENFHSILRAQSSEGDSGEMLFKKAKAVDRNKDASMSFSSTFITPKKYTFKRGKLEQLKFSASKESILIVVSKLQGQSANQRTAPTGNYHTFMAMKLLYLQRYCHLDFSFLAKSPTQAGNSYTSLFSFNSRVV